MVDVDKHACHTLAERGYRASLWPERYVTWDFLDKYPRSMEPRYLHLNWNHIPGMYFRKYLICTIVIEKKEWANLSEPAFFNPVFGTIQGTRRLPPDPLLWHYAGPPSMIVMMQVGGLNTWCRLP